MQHHHWARTIVNLFQTVIWVLVCNSVRIAAVVVLADNVSTWFASGAGHEMLGMAIFLYIMLMVISTDALIGVLLFRPLVSNAASWEASEANASSGEGLAAQPFSIGKSALGRWHKAGVGAFLFIGLLGIWVAVVHSGVTDQGMVALAMPEMPPPAEDDLPAVLGNGWRRVKFEHIKRDGDQLFAPESYVYQYAKNGRAFVVSVDLPWTAWHNLNVCYTGLGWESRPTYFVQRPQAGERVSQSELELTRWSNQAS